MKNRNAPDPVAFVLQSIVAELTVRKPGRSWRKLARDLNLPHTLVYDAGHGRWLHVSWANTRRLCVALNLPDPGPLVSVLAWTPPPTRPRACVGIGGLDPDLRDALNLERRRRRLTWNEYLKELKG